MNDALTKQIRKIIRDELKRNETDGTVVSVGGRYAAVDFGSGALPGFFVPWWLDVRVGDHVRVFRRAGYLYVLDVLNRNALAPGPEHPRIISVGSVSTDAMTAPGTKTATVDIELGLSYVPLTLVYYTEGTAKRPVPDTVVNASGQNLDIFRFKVEATEGNVTRLTVSTQTTRPAGKAAVTFRWLIFERTIE